MRVWAGRKREGLWEREEGGGLVVLKKCASVCSSQLQLLTSRIHIHPKTVSSAGTFIQTVSFKIRGGGGRVGCFGREEEWGGRSGF